METELIITRAVSHMELSVYQVSVVSVENLARGHHLHILYKIGLRIRHCQSPN